MKRTRWASYIIPTISAGLKKHGSTGCGTDLVDIKVTAAKYNGIVLEFCYEIYHQKDGKLCTTGKSRHCFLNKEAKPVSLKKENAVLHQKILTFIGKDVQDPDKKQDS